MLIKISWLMVISTIMLSCSPVKFNSKSTDPQPTPPAPCEGESCFPPPDGTSLWKVGEWGLCSQTCDGGTQSRSVSCVNKNNEVISEDNCKELKPASTQACNQQNCPVDPKPLWNVGPWSACSASCGRGQQTRIVECRDTEGVKPENLCLDPKPATQQECNSDPCACIPKDKSLNLTVPANNNKVDLLIVVDDSSSMTQDNLKLAQRLNGFVADLQNINLDWQMCITTTDVDYYEGRPIVWSGTSTRVINKSTANLATIFQQTISDIGSGYGNDEQGIKASILSMLNNPVYPCYRANSANAVIIISDEDERSVGGNQSLSSQQFKPLGFQNQPATFINTAKSVFGSSKRMAVNSIVVRDAQCKQAQDPQGSPSFIGHKYMDLANMTNGTVGNICDTDYSSNLKYFKDSILNTVSSVDLACIPVGEPIVTLPSGYTWTLQGSKVTFTPALATGVTLTINYKCCP